jgi:hypothetical protein
MSEFPHEIQQALAHVRSLLTPSNGFVSGTKLYEPEPTNPLVATKRATIEFAARTTDFFDTGRVPARADLVAWQKRCEEYRVQFDSSTADPEAHDYLTLLSALDRLITVSEKL